jgi:D-alanine-D-alanine ligase
MRIAVLANLQMNAPQYDGMPADRWHDLDSPKTINGIIAALEGAGHEAVFMEASIQPPYNLIERLRDFAPDLCFNISESHFGNAREAQVPALLEMLRIPYTGSSALTLALALDKPMTKRILQYHGLPTPEFQVFEEADQPVDADLLNEDDELRFPLFVKPSAEGTSMGVSGESIVRTVAQLRSQVAKQLARYQQPILVERCIPGREIMVGMVGNLPVNRTRRANERALFADAPDTLTFFPPLEVDTTQHDPSEGGVYTNRMKVELADEYHYFCPAPLTEAQVQELQCLAAATFRAVECRDVARIDFRLDENDGYKPYILEINPLPGMNPRYSDLCLQALAMGWEHERLVKAIVDAAAARHGLLNRILMRAPVYQNGRAEVVAQAMD